MQSRASCGCSAVGWAREAELTRPARFESLVRCVQHKVREARCVAIHLPWQGAEMVNARVHLQKPSAASWPPVRHRPPAYHASSLRAPDAQPATQDSAEGGVALLWCVRFMMYFMN